LELELFGELSAFETLLHGYSPSRV